MKAELIFQGNIITTKNHSFNTLICSNGLNIDIHGQGIDVIRLTALDETSTLESPIINNIDFSLTALVDHLTELNDSEVLLPYTVETRYGKEVIFSKVSHYHSYAYVFYIDNHISKTGIHTNELVCEIVDGNFMSRLFLIL